GQLREDQGEADRAQRGEAPAEKRDSAVRGKRGRKKEDAGADHVPHDQGGARHEAERTAPSARLAAAARRWTAFGGHGGKPRKLITLRRSRRPEQIARKRLGRKPLRGPIHAPLPGARPTSIIVPRLG